MTLCREYWMFGLPPVTLKAQNSTGKLCCHRAHNRSAVGEMVPLITDDLFSVMLTGAPRCHCTTTKDLRVLTGSDCPNQLVTIFFLQYPPCNLFSSSSQGFSYLCSRSALIWHSCIIWCSSAALLFAVSNLGQYLRWPNQRSHHRTS